MLQKICLTSLLLLLLAGCASPVQRIDSADLTGEHFWKGRVDIYGDVVFDVGSRLTIAPGSEIVFHPPKEGQDRWQDHPNFIGSELIIRGALVAEGTASEPILFRAADMTSGPGAWGGINISASAESHVRYCRFQQADSALHIQESTVYIEHSRFLDNLVGVRFHSSSILIEQNRFQNNDTGVRFHFGDPVICRNDFVDNRRAIFITSHPRNILIENNSFINSRENHIVLGEEVPEDVPAMRNWWGTTNPQTIFDLLYDGRRESHLGLILIKPLRSSPDPESGPQ